MSDLTLLEVFILILLLKVLLLFIFDDPRRDRGVVFIDRKLGFVEGFVGVWEVGMGRGVVGVLDVIDDGWGCRGVIGGSGD